MVVLKTTNELALMREAGRIAAKALALGGEMVCPGVTTGQIDAAVRRLIEKEGAKPSFLGYGGFPASACISVNEEVIHGVPGSRVIREGDIVSIDVGAFYKGYHGDNAATFGVGEISPEAAELINVTRRCLEAGVRAATAGNRVGDVSHAVFDIAQGHGYGVVREYVGHGVGRKMHESPEVPNYGSPGRGVRLLPGMVMAIEPMINLIGDGVKTLQDGCVVTASGSVSAHFEHTVAVTESGPEILTYP